MKLVGCYAVEWSPEQQCFHIETLNEMYLQNNKDAIERNIINNWLCLGVFTTYEEASKHVSWVRKKQEEYGMPRKTISRSPVIEVENILECVRR